MAEEEELTEEQLLRRKQKLNRPERRLAIKLSDMPEDVAEEVVEFAQQALDSQKLQKDQAAYIKRKCDEKYGGTWHCIVGQHFGSNVNHDAYTIINFYLDKTAFLVFRSGPPEKPKEDAKAK
eukprot:EG_transcript_35304